MSTADLLLELIFSWIEQRELCVEQLRKLAQELESLREKCNGSECVGSTVSVVGATCLIGAGLAAVLSGGAAAPALVWLGAAYTGVGLTISVTAKIIEHFVSSDTMKKAQEIEEKSNNIEKKIQKLFQQLKAEHEEAGRFPDPDEVDRHIMTEILRAMARRSGLKQQSIDRICIDDDDNDHIFYLDARPRMLFKQTLAVTVLTVLTFFTFELSGKKYKLLLSKGVEQLIQIISSNGFKAALKGGAMAVGGAVGLAFALPEAIDNWKEQIQNNHVTEASQSLRDTADALLKICCILKEQFNKMKTTFDKMAECECDQEDEERDSEDKESEQKDEERDSEDEESEQKDKRRDSEDEESEQKDKKSDSEDEESEQEDEESDSEDEESEQKDKKRDSEDKAIKMGMLNLWSMKKKVPRIRDLILQNDLDVFATTETWLNDITGDEVLREASPEDFSFHHAVRGSRGGGAALQVSQNLWAERIHFNGITTFEYVATELQHNEWDEPVLTINVYRPPGGNSEQFRAFLDEFQSLLDEVSKTYHSIIVTGDFNIWVDAEKMSSLEFYILLLINDLDQHVREPTHRGGHTLDLVITRNVQVSGLRVQDDGISDHYSVYFNAWPVSRDTKEEAEENVDEDEQVKRLKRKEE